MKSKKSLRILLTLMLVFGAMTLFAQDPGPDPGGDPDAPIDGGMLVLAAAGAAYGYRKLKQKEVI